ncbi:MAG: VOC family protein [candidate division WOR-3 bacterium]|nr:MAG: VOC family protein [candidate division WOR-3 bacterium]
MKAKPVCDHIGLFTEDAQRIKEFYVRVFGFEPGDEKILSGTIVADIFGLNTDCRFIKLRKDGFVIEVFEPLLPRLQKQLASRIGINHWGCCVKERATLIRKLQKENIPIIEIKKDGHSVYFVIDPDGNKVEVRECQK